MTFDEFYDILHDFLNKQPYKVYESLYNNILKNYKPVDGHDIAIQVFKDIRFPEDFFFSAFGIGFPIPPLRSCPRERAALPHGTQRSHR